jgi:hypothetical protein
VAGSANLQRLVHKKVVTAASPADHERVRELPTGTVTFLFTDIDGRRS